MAPVPSRYSRPLLTPQPSKILSLAPSHVKRVFLQLLAGTVSIFVLAVLLWRIGRFFRFFTKGKVHRKGNTTGTRYAKTWYGWVSLQQYEANKKGFRDLGAKIRRLTAWRSSTADYNWVWWDPGQKEFDLYHEKRKSLRYIPRCVRSYGFTKADTIYNPDGTVYRDTSEGQEAKPCPPIVATGALPLPDNLIFRPLSLSRQTAISIHEHFSASFTAWTPITHQQQYTDISCNFAAGRRSRMTFHSGREFISLDQSVCLLSSNHFHLSSLDFNPTIPCSFSMPCIPRDFPIQSPKRSNLTLKSVSSGSEEGLPEILPMLRCSRKYQIWSAQMGLQTLSRIGYRTQTLPSAPPGSPRSALLRSISLDSTIFGRTSQFEQARVRKSQSRISYSSLYSARHRYNMGRAKLLNTRKSNVDIQKWHSAPYLCNQSLALHPPVPPTSNKRHAHNSVTQHERKHVKERKQPTHISSAKWLLDYTLQAGTLSRWEVRVVDSLDRKLEWLSNQLSPGRRPFHFALLANHWLNKKTWIIYDPVSRVPLDARRRLGDPRFNVPYPSPTWAHKPKYPPNLRQPAHIPRIKSWRAAVNRHRRACGLKSFIQGIKLYDGSADDPPDGNIDPASWILRKPPQGFSFSSRQMESYYESGTGWQEKLGDWQKIRRGYRIHKAIHEGRANRIRAKEVANGITRYYRLAISRVSKPANSL